MAKSSSKPNILVIWGDDMGVHNVSAYNHGVMGYRTPNIHRIAQEGALFTDAYAQQSCTAGGASFILGQHPFCRRSASPLPQGKQMSTTTPAKTSRRASQNA